MLGVGQRLGTCPICMGLSGASLALSLLVAGLGASLSWFPLTAAGLAAAAVTGVLVLLHGVFYVLRRKERPPPPPTFTRGTVTIVSRGSCCGRR